MAESSQHLLILTWCMGGKRNHAEIVLVGDSFLTHNDITHKLPDSFREKHFDFSEIRKYFEESGWNKFMEMMCKLKKKSYCCGMCKEILRRKDHSVQCDRCFSWSHYRCGKIKNEKNPFFCLVCRNRVKEGNLIAL